MHRLKLLYGQVCIALGEIEAARQLPTDGFATTQQTFGVGDVLTVEFQTTLAKVYIERREIELAISYLSSVEIHENSGRSDFCAITAEILRAKVLKIMGALDEADSLLENRLNLALPIFGIEHSMVWRIIYDIVEVKISQEEYATAEQMLRVLRDQIIEVKGLEHFEVLQITLQLACTKLRLGEFEEAGQICQALLVQQQKPDIDTNDLTSFTKAVLWACHLQSGKIDSEGGLKDDLLKSLESGSIPNPQLARRWEMVALLAKDIGVVDVASAVKKHYYKAMELALGVEYLQATEKKEASPEDSNSGYSLSSRARWWQRCVFWWW